MTLSNMCASISIIIYFFYLIEYTLQNFLIDYRNNFATAILYNKTKYVKKILKDTN